MKVGSRCVWVALAFALVLSASSALFSAPQEPSSQAAAEAKYQPIKVFGMQVWIDPETGQLRTPTPEESAQLAAAMQSMLRAPAAPATAVYHSNGMVSMATDGSLMDFSIVTAASDGSLSFSCVNGFEDAEKAVNASSQSVQREER